MVQMSGYGLAFKPSLFPKDAPEGERGGLSKKVCQMNDVPFSDRLSTIMTQLANKTQPTVTALVAGS